jgi:hypothetical protein
MTSTRSKGRLPDIIGSDDMPEIQETQETSTLPSKEVEEGLTPTPHALTDVVAALASAQRQDRQDADNRFAQIMAAIQAMATQEAHQQRTPSVLPSVERVPTLSPLRELSDEPHRRPRLSAKAPDPEKLTDGVNPTFNTWALEMRDKFEANEDHFVKESVRKGYVYNRTDGDAKKFLTPRYKVTAKDPFTSAQEMLAYLAVIFHDPHHLRTLKNTFQDLVMKPGQHFHEFRTNFIHQADEAQIPADTWFDEMHRRLPLFIQDRLALALSMYEGDFTALCTAVSGLDTELRRIDACRAKRAANRGLSQTYVKTPGIRAPLPALSSASMTSRPRATTPASYPIRLTTMPPEKVQGVRATTVSGAKLDSVQCFNCGEMGHYSSHCTKPARAAELKEVEDMDLQESEEEDPESGKDST